MIILIYLNIINLGVAITIAKKKIRFLSYFFYTKNCYNFIYIYIYKIYF